jgi:hypothetical protein
LSTAAPPATPPAPVESVADALAPPAPTPARAPAPKVEPVAEPEGDIRADIAALRASYQQASKEIEGFDQLERDIGRGTLRLEAAHTLGQLRSTGPGLTEADLEPLKTYVETLSGGKKSEVAVNSLNKAAKKVVRDVFASLSALALKGTVAVIAGVAAIVFGASAELGTAVALALFGLSAAAAAWLLRESGRLAGQAAELVETITDRSWEWAGNVGTQAEGAMAAPRVIEKQLWVRRAGAAPWRHTSLATKARRWAQGIVGLCYAAFAFCALGFISGFVLAIETKTQQSSGYGVLLMPLGLG